MAKRRTRFNHRHRNDRSIARGRANIFFVMKWIVVAASLIDALLSIIEKLVKIK